MSYTLETKYLVKEVNKEWKIRNFLTTRREHLIIYPFKSLEKQIFNVTPDPW